MRIKGGRGHRAVRPAVALTCLALLLLGTSLQLWAETPFSFVVVGDTRTEPYLTGGPGQSAAMTRLLKERYISKDIPVRLFFGPAGLELTRAEVWETADSLLIRLRGPCSSRTVGTSLFLAAREIHWTRVLIGSFLTTNC